MTTKNCELFVKVQKEAYQELIADYEKRTDEIDNSILSAAKNRFQKEKEEFVKRRNFIQNLKINTIIL
jgi:hypothetical protein